MIKNFSVLSFCLLFVFDVSNASGWVLIGQTDDVSYYMNFDSKRKTGPFSYRIWELWDLKKPIHGIASTQMLIEYDCKDERFRFLESRDFAGNMGLGKMFLPDTSSRWNYPSPNGDPSFSIICSR